MRIFIERFVLAILAPLVVLLAVTNPIGFSWPPRIIGVMVIVVVAGIAAYFASWEAWHWNRLRGLWWLWSIFGLSGGFALAVWLSPRLEDIYPTIHPDRFDQPPAAAAPFTPAWLTLDRQNTFRSGALSIINAAGNLPPTTIETIAEPQTESFARTLVDMFIQCGFHPRDFGQSDYVGTPTTHRLTVGITIVAPVPSLAAETLRVGFERIGIQTRRSTDHSRSGDYLVVEVGPPP